MTKNEMIIKMLKDAGWQITNETDEDGSAIVKAEDEKNKTEPKG